MIGGFVIKLLLIRNGCCKFLLVVKIICGEVEISCMFCFFMKGWMKIFFLNCWNMWVVILKWICIILLIVVGILVKLIIIVFIG